MVDLRALGGLVFFFIFLFLPGEVIQVDYSIVFKDGLVQPSTRVGRFQKSHSILYLVKEDGSSLKNKLPLVCWT